MLLINLNPNTVSVYGTLSYSVNPIKALWDNSHNVIREGTFVVRVPDDDASTKQHIRLQMLATATLQQLRVHFRNTPITVYNVVTRKYEVISENAVPVVVSKEAAIEPKHKGVRVEVHGTGIPTPKPVIEKEVEKPVLAKVEGVKEAEVKVPELSVIKNEEPVVEEIPAEKEVVKVETESEIKVEKDTVKISDESAVNVKNLNKKKSLKRTNSGNTVSKKKKRT